MRLPLSSSSSHAVLPPQLHARTNQPAMLHHESRLHASRRSVLSLAVLPLLMPVRDAAALALPQLPSL